MPLLRCLRPSEADCALREVHEGICCSHIGSRILAHKLLRQGYYWLKMQNNIENFIKCDRCQRNANVHNVSASQLTLILSPWSFVMWGMDILSPFPMVTDQKKFLIVAIDYFAKWVEAEPLAQITKQKVRDFI